MTADNQSWQFDPGGGLRATDRFGTTTTYDRVRAATPSVDDLRQLAGVYVSDEAETTLAAAVEGSSLVLRRRPDTTLRLTPVYPDAFTAPELGLLIVRRDAGGRVTGLSIVQDRVWDLRFERS